MKNDRQSELVRHRGGIESKVEKKKKNIEV
jgi:hypothetical protein